MPPFDFWEARNEAHDALQVAIAERAPLSYIFGPGDHATYFVTPAEKSAVESITVSPAPGHTSAGSSLQAPAGAVVAGAGTLRRLPLAWLHMIAPCGNWRARCYAMDLDVRPLWGVMNTMAERRA